MNILLISIQRDLDVIGLKSIHYTLIENGYRSHLLFLTAFEPKNTESLNSLRNFINKTTPSFIGISLMSTEYFSAVAVTDALRTITDAPIIWGGIHPTIAPEECLNHADYACRGEAEQVVVDIARTLDKKGDLRGINNLCYKSNGSAIKNPLYKYEDELDRLPLTGHLPIQSYIMDCNEIRPLTTELFRQYARYRGTTYSIMTSRGCPFSCTYCCNNFLFSLYGSKKVRRRHSAHVIAELEQAVSEHPYISLINFQDDSFLSAPVETIQEFCSLYKTRVNKPFVVRCIPNSVTKEKLILLKKAGLSWISLGLQSGSDRVCRDVYRRMSTKASFLNAAAIINELRIAAFYDIILDNPFENDEDRLETARTLMQTPKPFYAQFYSLTLYLGTELHEMAKQKCPDGLEDYRTKEYLAYDSKMGLNNLIRISAYAGQKQVGQLLDFYDKAPDSLGYRIAYCIQKTLCLMLYEPLSYARVLMRAHHGSIVSVLKQVPNIFGDLLSRYRIQFKRG